MSSCISGKLLHKNTSPACHHKGNNNTNIHIHWMKQRWALAYCTPAQEYMLYALPQRKQQNHHTYTSIRWSKDKPLHNACLKILHAVHVTSPLSLSKQQNQHTYTSIWTKQRWALSCLKILHAVHVTSPLLQSIQQNQHTYTSIGWSRHEPLHNELLLKNTTCSTAILTIIERHETAFNGF
jgi:hypothetical protein